MLILNINISIRKISKSKYLHEISALHAHFAGNFLLPSGKIQS